VSTPAGGSFTAIALLMLATGMGIPVMAALNANLGQHIQSPVAASAILFALGFIVSAMILIFVGLPNFGGFRGVSPWVFAAALLVAFYLISITWSAPRIGVGNAVFFVLLGQLVAAAAIDHWGLFGAIQVGLTWRRAVGLLVMAVGVYLAKKPR
jgi:transporter family-2 protein